MSDAFASALSGPEKAAVLLLAIGPEKSTRLLSGLKPSEAAVLSRHLASVRAVDEATRQRVLREFRDSAACRCREPDPEGGDADSVADERMDLRGTPSSPGRGREPDHTSPDVSAKAGAGGIRPFDFSALERVPRQSLRSPGGARGCDLELLADVPVRCRARLAAVPLSLANLHELEVGDIVVLKPAADIEVELVGGERSRRRGRLCSKGHYRAVELIEDRCDQEGAE